MADPAPITDLPFFLGILEYASRKRRNPSFFLPSRRHKKTENTAWAQALVQDFVTPI